MKVSLIFGNFLIAFVLYQIMGSMNYSPVRSIIYVIMVLFGISLAALSMSKWN